MRKSTFTSKILFLLRDSLRHQISLVVLTIGAYLTITSLAGIAWGLASVTQMLLFPMNFGLVALWLGIYVGDYELYSRYYILGELDLNPFVPRRTYGIVRIIVLPVSLAIIWSGVVASVAFKIAVFSFLTVPSIVFLVVTQLFLSPTLLFKRIRDGYVVVESEAHKKARIAASRAHRRKAHTQEKSNE